MYETQILYTIHGFTGHQSLYETSTNIISMASHWRILLFTLLRKPVKCSLTLFYNTTSFICHAIARLNGGLSPRWNSIPPCLRPNILSRPLHLMRVNIFELVTKGRSILLQTQVQTVPPQPDTGLVHHMVMDVIDRLTD